MKFKNSLLKFFLFLLFIIPVNTLAYSNFIIPGGETIGIEVNSKGVLVVGFYKINDRYIAREAGFSVGDTILGVNGKDVSDISMMIDTIEEGATEATFKVLRSGVITTINLNLESGDDNVLKTGLYVKDQITGIGTLTYIDPETKIFGSLGHEILESTTALKFEIKSGKIFDAKVDSITKSRNGSAGEKNATYDKTNVYGTIKYNEIPGIFGTYTKEITNREKLEVAKPTEVIKGEAVIRTVVKDDEVEDFTINILNVDSSSKTKNILFEITDNVLLEETGGVVQGMSGSPIIQNGKIVGAVNYVIVNDTNKGYGIFITTMLKEGEK